MVRFGYCCINTTLAKKKITSNRIITRTRFQKNSIMGEKYLNAITEQNLSDLLTILQWNVERNIRVFRIGSALATTVHPGAPDRFNSPWLLGESSDDSLPKIFTLVRAVGHYIRTNDIRVSFHPDHFVKLASASYDVVNSSRIDLNAHEYVFNVMNLPKTQQYPINIHVGMKYSKETLNRFVVAAKIHKVSMGSDRLVVENDDNPSCFSVRKLMEIHERTGLPITFDYFHHALNPDGLTEEEAFKLAYSTWPSGVTPLFHYSDSKKIYEDPKARLTAHSDYVHNHINTYDMPVDIELEVKKKELALFDFLNEKPI